MGKIIYITGGARSGKSTFAEEKAISFGEKINYIATSEVFDDETKKRVEEHQKRRDSRFVTVEAYKKFDQVFKNVTEGTILFDCMTNMVNNLMFENNIDWDNVKSQEIDEIEKEINTEVDLLLNEMEKHVGTSIVVSNELGMGLVPIYPLGRYFRDIAGRINQKIAKHSDEVYFVVSGIPMKIKGE